MSERDLYVFPWLQGCNSPQLDYIDCLTDKYPLTWNTPVFEFGSTAPLVGAPACRPEP
jgi:hypothetical protein